MRVRRGVAVRAAVMVLPAVLLLSLATVARASAPASSLVHANRAEAEEALRAAVQQGFTLPSWATNTIGNASGVGFGVIDDRDGQYNRGNYDEILGFELWTHEYYRWVTTAGWYTGPGYCTAQMRSDDRGATWYRQYPDLGAGQHFIGARTSYFVTAYRC